MDSPHKERDLIGQDVDLNLLYLSLKWIQESWVGERDSKLTSRSTMGRERVWAENLLRKSSNPKEEEGEGYLYPSQKLAVAAHSGRIIRPKWGPEYPAYRIIRGTKYPG